LSHGDNLSLKTAVRARVQYNVKLSRRLEHSGKRSAGAFCSIFS
jgi:hypothetical protein